MTLKSILIGCFTFIPISNAALAQGNVYLNGGIEFNGITENYRFQQNGNFLKRGFMFEDGPTTSGIGLTFNIAIHKTISPYFAIELGSQFTEMDLVVRDGDFQNRNHVFTSDSWLGNLNGVKADNGNFDFANWYYSNYLAAYFFIPGRSNISPYLGGGVTVNYFTSQARTVPAAFYFNNTDENLQLTPNFSQHYTGGFAEVGVLFGPRDTRGVNGGGNFFLGLKYYFAGDIISGDYQNTKNGTVQYADRVVASGSYVALSLRFGTEIMKAKRRHEHSPRFYGHHRDKNPRHFHHTKVKRSKKEKSVPLKEKKTSPTALGW